MDTRISGFVGSSSASVESVPSLFGGTCASAFNLSFSSVHENKPRELPPQSPPLALTHSSASSAHLTLGSKRSFRKQRLLQTCTRAVLSLTGNSVENTEGQSPRQYTRKVQTQGDALLLSTAVKNRKKKEHSPQQR